MASYPQSSVKMKLLFFGQGKLEVGIQNTGGYFQNKIQIIRNDQQSKAE